MKRAHEDTDPYRRPPPPGPGGPSLAPLAPAPSMMAGGPPPAGQGQMMPPPPPPQGGLPPVDSYGAYAGVPPRGSPAGPVPPAQPVPQPQSYRQLNVKDALLYLDQVKLQFEHQPDVYNQFLDIMKDFKSQSIDTPGVIQRVSTLFRGHRNLIQGFNTFLPPGFKIELPSDDANLITVHIEGSPQGSYQINANAPLGTPLSGYRAAPTAAPQHYAPPAPQVPPPPPPHAANLASSARKQPIEFSQAIHYVNKIKTRFSAQPDIYKSFLEILHTYQKEQKSIKEVYDQVASLFRNHPDLLSEFSQFLPDTSAPHPPQGRMYGVGGAMMPPMGDGAVGMGSAYSRPPPSAPATAEHFMQPMRSRGKQPPTKVKGRGASAAAAAAAAGAAAGAHKGAAAPYYSHTKDSASPLARPGGMAPAGMQSMPGSLVSTAMAAGTPAGQLEEVEFFDRVKRALSNRQQYNEFLRCLNLFSQEILSKQDLVGVVGNFLSRHPDLFDWFKRIIGYKEPAPGTEVPSIDKRPMPEVPTIDYSKLKRLGSSYRALPKNFQHPKCSGRTDLCEEVLNNVWVSFPIWSEDAPFLASKKNQYEEAIYKAEDERYELDHVIDANLATIRVLEGVQRKILDMTTEEQAQFRLGNNLGGTSEIIYRVAIRRAYGQHANEIIDGLKRNPVVAVPIVLSRLRQKDEEWRRGQREWNKIWREIYTKNYFRALDYQGIHFKSNDKKTLNVRSLVAEAEALLQEQRKRAEGSLVARPLPQFEFAMDDRELHTDVFRIMTGHLEKVGGISHADKDRIGVFLQTFLARFLRMDPAMLPGSRTSQAAEAAANGTDSMDVDTPASATVPDPIPVRATAEAAVDAARMRADNETLFANNTLYAFFRLYHFLYSRLGKVKAIAISLGNQPHGARRLNTAARNLGLQAKLTEQPPNGWYAHLLELIDRFVDGKLDQQRFEDTLRDIYGIASFPLSTVDKLTHALVKQIHNVIGDTTSRRLVGLYLTARGVDVPSLFVVSGEEVRESGDNADADGHDKEASREPEGASAGTRKRDKDERRRRERDRVAAVAHDDDDTSVASPTLRAVTETPAPNAAGASEPSRMPNLRRPTPYAPGAAEQDEDAAEIAAFRQEVESIVGDENVFKVDFAAGTRTLLIRLLPRPLSARWNVSDSVESRWSQYVDQYVRMEPTAPELVPTSKVFLQRTRRHLDPATDTALVIANDLECKICINTYKLYFVADTGDLLWRPAKRPVDEAAAKRAATKRAEAFHKWLEGENGWRRGEPHLEATQAFFAGTATQQDGDRMVE